MRTIVLLGATGSIGENTLKVLDGHPDKTTLVGIAARSRWRELAEIARKYHVRNVAIFEESAAREAKESGLFLEGTHFFIGESGLCELAELPDANLVVTAVVGTLGLRPTLSAIRARKDVAIASKEILVLAGRFVMETARKYGVKILPVDSEHNAIFQCIGAEPNRHLDRIILTASGGIFRDASSEEMMRVRPCDALKHPNWSMGPKVTVDSSTMANKGLELIEATWLFDLPQDKIDIVVHPQSIVHSMVKFLDGSVLAHLAPASMTFPIQNCISYPHRWESVIPSLDFLQMFHLDFYAPDYEKYKCLRLARECARIGGILPAVFNAANELAVEAFLQERIAYLKIPEIIETALSGFSSRESESLDDILAVDFETRQNVRAMLKR